LTDSIHRLSLSMNTVDQLGVEMILDPQEIIPLHGSRGKQQVKALMGDMEENGRPGRPLLVIERDGTYFAWTGSHRLTAAVEEEFTGVPCYVIPESAIIRYEATADHGHFEDHERLAIMRMVGDQVAIDLMGQEGRCN
jgi:hypothetical protein